MRTLSTLVVTIISLLGCVGVSANSLVIKNTSVISAERKAILRGQNVLIEKGRIVSVTSDPVSADIVLDGTGKYLIPGLIDSHVHLSGVPGMLPDHEAKYPQLAEQAKAQFPRSYLYFGFTTVNDLFSSQSVIDEWNQQAVRPDAHYCSGVPLANGYPMAWVPKEERFSSEAAEYFLYDTRQKKDIPDNVDPANHMPEAIIDRISNEGGATCVKTFYESGFGHLSKLPNPTLEMLRPLINSAHLKGLPVFMHANTQVAQEFAVKAGVDVIAHGMWHWKEKAGTEPSEELESLVTDIVRQNIGYQPTIQVVYGEQELFNESFFTSSLLSHSVPKELISWYQSHEGRWMQRTVAKNIGIGQEEISYERIKQSYEKPIRRAITVLKLLAETDARLLFGSDTPSGPLFTQLPGMNGRLEMQRWVEAGVNLEKLFRALTIDNADALGLEDTIGTVQSGKTANLLLLSANPLKSIDAYDEIDWIILNGKAIERKSLSAVD